LCARPNCFDAKAFGAEEASDELAQFRIIIDYENTA
jgi:hypothetical protein